MIKKFCLIGSALFLNAIAIAQDSPTCILEEKTMELTSYSNKEVSSQFPLLQEWLEREFRQYPYLWAPSKNDPYYLEDVFLNEKNSKIVIVRKGDQVIGVAAGLPLDSPFYQATLDPSLFKKMHARGFNLSKIFYISYFLTAPEYRNNPTLVSMIYNHLVKFAHALGKTQLCYLQDIGREDHPLKPQQPIPIEPWGYVIDGFTNMDVNIGISWPTLQSDLSVKDEQHEVEFLIKDIVNNFSLK